MIIKTARFLSFIGFFGMIGLFFGCAKYRPHQLETCINTAQTKNDVHVQAAVLSDCDCHYYFSRRTGKHGYKAIQLIVENNSNKPYVLDGRNIDIIVENKNDVAHSLSLNTTARVLGWGIGGLLFSQLWICAAVDGKKSSKANKKIKDDFNDRIIDNTACFFIAPGATLNKVIFVKKENLVSKFDLELVDKKLHQKLTFNVVI